MPASLSRKTLPLLSKLVPFGCDGVLVFIGFQVLSYSLMFMTNNATILLVSVLVYGRSPQHGSYTQVFVQYLALITGSRMVRFAFAMARNCKHLAILVYSTGVFFVQVCSCYDFSYSCKSFDRNRQSCSSSKLSWSLS